MDGQDRIFWRIGALFAKRSHAEERHRGRGGVRWRLLELLNIYRILVATVTIIVAVTPPVASALHIAAPVAVFIAGVAYFVLGLLAIPTLAHEWPNLWLQSQIEPILDLLAAVVIIQATGANLGILAAMLVPPVAVSAAAAKTRKQAIFFAALAALTVLAAAVGSQVSKTLPIAIYTEAGLFGLGIMAVALVAHTLARRLLESEGLAFRQGQKLKQLNAINNHIIAQLHTGIIVTDSDGQIQRTNPAAKALLDERARGIVTELAAHSKGREAHTIQLANGAPRIVHILPLEPDSAEGRLLFIEDAEAANNQAQALKLAALGRLTAGVAHQVRNPLSAIAQATQLLADTRGLDERSRNLISIISRQSTRLDAVVEDILGLSRPGAAQPRALDLADWLDGFLADYRDRQPRNSRHLKTRLSDTSIETHFDLGHLDHIVGNLLDNAFIHGSSPAGVELQTTRQDGDAWLEVLDRGPGLKHPERLFEPFFTTHASGTGLGLYIARELAQANGARLEAGNRSDGGTRFRLTFARNRTWLT